MHGDVGMHREEKKDSNVVGQVTINTHKCSAVYHGPAAAGLNAAREEDYEVGI